MPEICINLTEEELSEDDILLIQNSLGLAPGTDMAAVLPRLFKAALIEYIKMICEGGMAGRAAEIMQERLYHLIVTYFEKVPNENIVESIFQVTTSQSKTLIRNTQSRYRTRIADLAKRGLHQILISATPQGNDHELICTSTVAIEEMNKIIRLKGPSNALITRQHDTSNRYFIKADTYNLLDQQLR